MPVFISYRHTDRYQALSINEQLKTSGIITYIDVLDSESQSTDNITDVITKNIAQCTHLIAVVSETTGKSWWVPFEIGEATISQRRIASFQTGHSSLPEYLQKWPIMTQSSHLNLFIQQYKKDTVSVSDLVVEGSLQKSDRFYTTAIPSSRDFHKNLKRSIQAGYSF